jgi:hypothetical protein
MEHIGALGVTAQYQVEKLKDRVSGRLHDHNCSEIYQSLFKHNNNNN